MSIHEKRPWARRRVAHPFRRRRRRRRRRPQPRPRPPLAATRRPFPMVTPTFLPLGRRAAFSANLPDATSPRRHDREPKDTASAGESARPRSALPSPLRCWHGANASGEKGARAHAAPRFGRTAAPRLDADQRSGGGEKERVIAVKSAEGRWYAFRSRK